MPVEKQRDREQTSPGLGDAKVDGEAGFVPGGEDGNPRSWSCELVGRLPRSTHPCCGASPILRTAGQSALHRAMPALWLKLAF